MTVLCLYLLAKLQLVKHIHIKKSVDKLMQSLVCMCLSVFLSVCLSVYLSICLSVILDGWIVVYYH